MTYITSSQLTFALVDLVPNINLDDHCRTFWVGYPSRIGEQIGDAFILQWDIKDIEQPSQESLLARWEQIKGRYVDPFAKPKTIFGVREFRSRFTLDEQIAIRAASMTDMEVGIVYDDFQSAQFIDLNDPAVAAGLDLYIAKGLLDLSRRETLLSPG